MTDDRPKKEHPHTKACYGVDEWGRPKLICGAHADPLPDNHRLQQFGPGPLPDDACEDPLCPECSDPNDHADRAPKGWEPPIKIAAIPEGPNLVDTLGAAVSLGADLVKLRDEVSRLRDQLAAAQAKTEAVLQATALAVTGVARVPSAGCYLIDIERVEVWREQLQRGVNLVHGASGYTTNSAIDAALLDLRAVLNDLPAEGGER